MMKYKCIPCKFTTNKKSNMDAHNKTSKHESNLEDENLSEDDIDKNSKKISEDLIEHLDICVAKELLKQIYEKEVTILKLIKQMHQKEKEIENLKNVNGRLLDDIEYYKIMVKIAFAETDDE